MVKYALQIKARFENVKLLKIGTNDFRWYFKIRCSNCNWESESAIYLTMEDHVEVRRNQVNLSMKCHLCSREITIEILEPSVKPYDSVDEDMQNIAEFECRGGEPFEFQSSQGWVAVTESEMVFNDIDLSTCEWCDYDEEMSASVGIYDLKSAFVRK